MKTIMRGGVAGLVATVFMSVLMFGAKATGLMQTPPPKEITHRAGKKSDANPAKEGHDEFTLSWLAAHAAFGAGCGIVFALLRPVLPGGTVGRGLMYGETVWAANYGGILPALGLYPSPSKDANSRTAVMIAAHAVYGVSLAATEQRLAQARN